MYPLVQHQAFIFGQMTKYLSTCVRVEGPIKNVALSIRTRDTVDIRLARTCETTEEMSRIGGSPGKLLVDKYHQYLNRNSEVVKSEASSPHSELVTGLWELGTKLGTRASWLSKAS